MMMVVSCGDPPSILGGKRRKESGKRGELKGGRALELEMPERLKKSERRWRGVSGAVGVRNPFRNFLEIHSDGGERAEGSRDHRGEASEFHPSL